MSARLECAVAELVDALREEIRSGNAVSAQTVPRLLSIDEAADALGIGRTSTYALIDRGALRSLKVGRRRLISTSAIADYTDSR